MIVITPRVDLYLSGAWVDVSEDVLGDIRADWGMRGSSPSDRVADPGAMSFSLDNSDQCSGGVAGYYTPGHASARAGFGLNAPVRLAVVHEFFGEKIVWQGTITRLLPAAGLKRQNVAVTCADWLEEAARAKTSGLPVLANVQSDEVFQTVLDSMPVQPPNGAVLIGGSDVYPYALDNVQDEKGRILSEGLKIAISELGYIFVEAGVLYFEGRRRRAGAGAVKFAFDEDNLVDLAPAYSRDDVKNRVQVVVHPRRVDDAATTVLFNLGSPVQIARQTSFSITASYRDPNQPDKRCGGVGMVTPEEGVDYVLNSTQAGDGTDLSPQLTVEVRANEAADLGTWGGNSVLLRVTNNGPADGWLTVLQLRGRGLYDFEPVTADEVDAPSRAAYGENVFKYDMPYQSSPAVALDTAQFLLALNAELRVRAESITYVANWSDEVCQQFFGLSISDKVSVTYARLGLNAEPYFIQGIQLQVSRTGVITVTCALGPVDTTEFWQLDVEGRSELDETTVLGYGLWVPGWILGTSELGVDTFLA